MYAFVTCIIIAACLRRNSPAVDREKSGGRALQITYDDWLTDSRAIYGDIAGIFQYLEQRARARDVTYTGLTFGTRLAEYGTVLLSNAQITWSSSGKGALKL